MLVLDIADDLLDEILDGHQPVGAAVFVDDDRHVGLPGTHPREKVENAHRFRDVEDIAEGKAPDVAIRIEWAIPCRYAEKGERGATIVGAGSSVAHVPAFPAALAVQVYAMLVASDADAEDPIRMAATMHGPDMEPVGESIEVVLTMGERNPMLPEGWEQRADVIFQVAHAAPATGVYTLVLAMDGAENRGASVPLLVLDAGDTAE